jgi:hypothetical protein
MKECDRKRSRVYYGGAGQGAQKVFRNRQDTVCLRCRQREVRRTVTYNILRILLSQMCSLREQSHG